MFDLSLIPPVAPAPFLGPFASLTPVHSQRVCFVHVQLDNRIESLPDSWSFRSIETKSFTEPLEYTARVLIRAPSESIVRDNER